MASKVLAGRYELFEKIGEDYGRDSFEGYFVFDADNVLDEKYIEEMNEKNYSHIVCVVGGNISDCHWLWEIRE